ncbi:MAG TPA: hypothetical protein PLG73_16610 [Candidatus Sumerlaeota bacterium]|nr:hypothetical protein [Candidatus Sumerlaeota bacterium]
MKKLLAVVALAGLILIVWNWRSEGGGAARREQARPTPAPTSAPAAPIMPAGAANAQTPRPAAPPPAPTPAARRDPSPALMAAARQTGVQIVRYEEQSPGTAVITLNWSGDVATVGGDFLSEALAANVIRNFDVPDLDQGRQLLADGRSVWWSTYRIYF